MTFASENTMTLEDLQELAGIFKAMGEVSRLLLLKALMENAKVKSVTSAVR